MKTWYLGLVCILTSALAITAMIQNENSKKEIHLLSEEVQRFAAVNRNSPAPQDDLPPPIIREIIKIPTPVAAPPAPGPDEAAKPLPPPSPKPLEPAVIHERLEERFQDEPPDGVWARDAEHSAESGVVAALPDHSMLRSVECRASLCRIETEHADTERSHTFVKTAFMTPGRQVWNGDFVSMRTNDPADSKVITVTYLAREGMPLPMQELLASEEGSSSVGQ